MPGGDPFIGIKLGSYEILEAIGEGGMARIYKGYHAQLNRYAAIKVVHWGLQEDPAFTERFRREAQAIASLRHPNIVQIYDFGQHESGYYMAMEFIDGSDLAVILREARTQQKQLPPEQIVKTVKGVAAALDYAHRNGVIHRDVKPSNIMLNREGQPILTDFGLVMLPLQASQATMGSVFGTPHYVAPEQAISSADAVPASDIYSLGVVLFEMMTGRVPFDDESPLSVALKHVSDAPPLPTSINPNIPVQLEDVILKALAKVPADRFETAAELAYAVEDAFQGQVVIPTTNAVTVPGAIGTAAAVPKPAPVAPTVPVAPKQGLPGWLIFALVAVLGGIVGAAGLFLLDNNQTPPPPTATVAVVVTQDETPTPTTAATPALAPTDTPAPVDTPTPPPPPPTDTPSPTDTPTPTETPASTATPTLPPPTATPTVAPTNTPIPLPTFTPTPEGLAGKILFKTDRAGFVEIYQMDADGSNQRPLEDVSIYTQLESRLPFSPDGTSQIQVRGEGQLDLWWVNLTTGQELRITSTGPAEYDPAWSPVDDRIAFVSEETGRGDIYVINLGGSAYKRLTDNIDNFDKHPTWSPDGTKIAYWSDISFSHNRQIWQVDVATGELTSLSDNPFNDWDPVWVWK